MRSPEKLFKLIKILLKKDLLPKSLRDVYETKLLRRHQFYIIRRGYALKYSWLSCYMSNVDDKYYTKIAQPLRLEDVADIMMIPKNSAVVLTLTPEAMEPIRAEERKDA